MTALEFAASIGCPADRAADVLATCDSVIETGRMVAIRRGQVCHVAIELQGLGGKAALRDCRAALQAWQAVEPTLLAPVRHENARAIRLVAALGFVRFSEDRTHVWFKLERGPQ